MSSPSSIQQEFIAAYDAYADDIFRHCYFRVFDRERGKELMQEAFMKTWEYIASGKAVDILRAFLYKTANHLIIDEARRKKRRTVESLEDLQETGFDIADDNVQDMGVAIDAERVLTVLSRIEEPYRTAVVMRYIDELNPKEIAHALDEPVNVISVRITRGIKKLQSLIDAHE